MKRPGVFTAISVLIAVLGGCGGSHPPAQSILATGRASCIIEWPRDTRLIPAACNSIKVEIKSADTVLGSQTASRPPEGGQAVLTFSDLPAGDLTAVATAYPDSGSTGIPQAQASVAITVQDGQTTEFTLTMASTIDHIEIGPAINGDRSLAVRQSATLIATALDAAGRVVLVSTGALAWASSDPSIADVDSAGKVTGVAVGSVVISVTDSESGKSQTATLTIREAARIQPGETFSGNIATAGQMDTYTFSADSGDTVTILMGEKPGTDFSPQVELHAPDGTVVKIALGPSAAHIRAQKLTQTGTYYVLCLASGGTGTGEYAVSLIKNPGETQSATDPDGGPIQSGETKQGTITVGDLDAYTFSGNSGDTVTILMGEKPGADFSPQVELHAPDGTVVKIALGPSAATIQAQILPQTGTYYVLCLASGGTATGEYAVSLSKIPAGP